MTYPKVYVTGHKKKSIPRKTICLTDYDYDYISEEIERQNKIDFERYVEVRSYDEETLYEHLK